MTDHPQVGKRKQCLELQRVFLQILVAHLHKSELSFDRVNEVLDLGTDARLEIFDLVDGRINTAVDFVFLWVARMPCTADS